MVKKTIIFGIGWAFILLGIVSIVIPVLPNVLFILLGLLFLSATSPWAQRLVQKALRNHPEWHDKIMAIKGKILRSLGLE